ncbi:MAG: lipoprotein insertase outer membrane protein LolB [Halioglobus sp.]
MVLVMTGCSTQPNQTSADEDWKERSAKLQRLEVWHADGKVALRKADHSESVSLSWTQRNNHTDLNLSGPLGLGATKISSDGKTLEINKAGTSSSYDISSPEMIAKETGWDLPLQALQHWLKGVPAPSGNIQKLEVEKGLLKTLEQFGWTITYQNYGQFGPYTLPTNLQIERSNSRARLIVRNWKTKAV